MIIVAKKVGRRQYNVIKHLRDCAPHPELAEELARVGYGVRWRSMGLPMLRGMERQGLIVAPGWPEDPPTYEATLFLLTAEGMAAEPWKNVPRARRGRRRP